MAQTPSGRYHSLSQRVRKLLRVRKPAVNRRGLIEYHLAEAGSKATGRTSHASSLSSLVDDYTPVTPDVFSAQSPFFRKLPLEIREQIYAEFWQCAGLNRHVYLEDDDFRFAICQTDHDAAEDSCQTGLAHDFYPEPMVQRHPKWYDRMTSPWCNHWKCEEAMRQKRKPGSGAKEARDDILTCLPLLLSCQRIYMESIPSLHKSTTLTITDKDTLHAIFIRRHSRTTHPVHAFLPRIRTLNIALRAGAPDFLQVHGPALWRALAPSALPSLRRISVWLDGHEPIQRRLLPQFRDLWTHVPGPVARKLTVSLPVGADGLWAWGEVEVRPWSGSSGSSATHPGRAAGIPALETLPAFKPEFEVVLRGWQAYTETSAGWVSRGGGAQGPGARRVLAPGNPFEDLKLYGRGWFDDFYYREF
ncbi:hypothetical protein ACHAQA_005142 [Verticillium albo-atrum]